MALRHLTAGVDATVYWEFKPGERVLTAEGLAGVVTAVEDGAYPGAEHYLVTLDHGMGGGEYAPGELRPLSRRTAAGMIRHSVERIQEEDAEDDFDQHRFSMVEDGQEVGYLLVNVFTSGWGGHGDPAHSVVDTVVVQPTHRRKGVATALLREAERVLGAVHHSEWQTADGAEWSRSVGGPRWGDPSTWKTGSLVSEREPDSARTAADDYPELGTILIERPNHPHALPVGAVLAAVDDWHNSDGLSPGAAGADLYEHIQSKHPHFPADLGVLDRALAPPWGAEGMRDILDQAHADDHLRNGECGAHEGPDAYKRHVATLGADGLEVMAGPFDRVLDRFNDSAEKALGRPADPHNTWSYDWCRFRRNRRCMFSTQLDADATERAGYAVWVPADRGLCPRDSWDAQRACPVAEPGPRSGDPRAKVDATVPWGEGGQRGGMPMAALLRQAAILELDPADMDAGERHVQELIDADEFTYVGLAVKAADSGRVLLAQRTPFAGDPEGVFGRWEFPGGGIEEGEDPLGTAMREFREETGLELPEQNRIAGGLKSGSYLLVVVIVPSEAWTVNASLLDFEVMGLGWFHPDQIEGTDLAREEMDDTQWDLIREAARYEIGDTYSIRRGPKAGQEATVLWERHVSNTEGDDYQHVAVESSEGQRWTFTAPDPEWGFHLTAAWSDVRAKAKKLRSEGRVRIISSPGADGRYITAEVRGDHNVYQTTIMRQPGRKAVASWECGCDWAAYSWGRSGRWKRFEGRMCSHALALVFEAQAQEMFGGEIAEQAQTPAWRMDPTVPVKQPQNYPKPKRSANYYPTTTNSQISSSPRPVSTDSALAAPPAVSLAAALLGDGVQPSAVLAWISALGAQDAPGLVALAIKEAAGSFPAKVRGWVHNVIRVEDGIALLDDGTEVPAHSLLYPTYDPRLGLDVRDSIPHIATEHTAYFSADSPTGAAMALQVAARQFEQQVTPALRRAAQAHGGTLQGFDARVKGWDSLFKKIEAYMARSSVDAATAAGAVNDALRYTVEFPTDSYAEGIGAVLSGLASAGFHPKQGGFKNYWLQGDPYQGINVAMTTPSRFPWELQFHTVESYAHKKAIHPLYDVVEGKRPGTLADKQRAWDEMARRAESVPLPSGVIPMQRLMGQPRPAFAGLVHYRYFTQFAEHDPMPTLVYRMDTSTLTFEFWNERAREWTIDQSLAANLVLGGTTHTEVPEAEADRIINSKTAAVAHYPPYCDAPWWLVGPSDEVVVIADPGVQLPLEGSPEAASGIMRIEPTAKDRRFEGVGGPFQDDDGWFVRTHRARSDSYPTPEEIPDSAIEFIRSTGAADQFVFEADIVSDAFDALEDGWRAGEVDADRISWYAPSDAGQGLARDDLGEDAFLFEGDVIQGAMAFGAGLADDDAPVEGAGAELAAVLHDEPEPALPGTDGDAEAEIKPPAWLMEDDPRKRHARENSEIAAMARRVVKEGLKAFSPAEQAEIINEGEGVTASNLDRLDLAGTHYEALEAAMVQAGVVDDDEVWMA